MEKTQSLYGLRIALLIDFDNVVLGIDDPPGFDVELIVNALRSRGNVVLGRAYGDWYRHNRHRRKLMEQGIELVETPVFGPLIKNSADIRIALDGQEIAMTQEHIDCFCLVSGDSDFLPLIKRIQYLGKSVIVIAGTKFTSELVRRNCNEYISYENLLAQSVGAAEDATSFEGACHLLARTISTLQEQGMEVRSSTVKQMMVQLNPVFSERNFQCNQFKQFLDKAVGAGVIKLGRRDTTSGEYTVFLADEDWNGAPETAKVETVARSNGRATRRRTTRTRTPRDKDEAQDEAKTTVEADTTEAAAPTETATPDEAETASDSAENATETERGARGTLRRGRLRFSGRTGRSDVADEKEAAASADENADDADLNVTDIGPGDIEAEIEQAKSEAVGTTDEETNEEDENQDEVKDEATDENSDQSSEAAESDEATDETQTAEQSSEAADAEATAAETEPKKRSRGGRRRKSTKNAEAETETAADQSDNNGAASNDNAASDESAAEPSGDNAADEAPAKKTRARRTTRRKTVASSDAEAGSDDSPDDNATESDASESEASEKPKKTTRRRRTTRKKTEDGEE